MSLLKTPPASSIEDVRQFFEAFAAQNIEQHGKASQLLNYRVSLLKKYARFHDADCVLDIGCGNGHHLYALDGSFQSATGIDIASGMVETAQTNNREANKSRYHFQVDDAHTLQTIKSESIDVVLCVGALEHMVDKEAVLAAVYRVLKKNGRFVCLTLNDQFVWYRKLAPRLGYATQHLATDRRLDGAEAKALLKATGFSSIKLDAWTFIPRGDMPRIYAGFCRLLDAAGRLALPFHLRGGLVMYGEK